jgi:uncharacterized protein (TIGR00269 family)
MECSICQRKAVYHYRYNGSSACREHFNENFEKRVKQEIRNQVKFRKPVTHISVAISGGKDSSVTLSILVKLLKERRDVKISAFTVDEGIEGYRSSGLQSSIDLCNSLGIAHSTRSYMEEFGTSMDRVVLQNPHVIPCSRCGPMRRNLINNISTMQEADYVALGLNLDDYAQSVMMNVVRGDLERMKRMAPHLQTKEGLVRRILPLMRIPEKEVVAYEVLNGIPFDSSWCPYYSRAQRNTFREMIGSMEEKSPGAKFGILRFSEELRKQIPNDNAEYTLNRCQECGSPTSGNVCSVCMNSE